MSDTIKQQAHVSPVASLDDIKVIINNRRKLRTSEMAVSDDEERGAIDTLRAKLIGPANKVLTWLKRKEVAAAEKAKTKKLVEFVRTQARSENLDDAVRNLQKEGITHGQVKEWLRLDKEQNQWKFLDRDSPLYLMSTNFLTSSGMQL
ncbi:hypothetical protein GN244_ATG10887 [Phytophthora infestans]|uniref:Uncharacterized protein n=1 Tax=Phytophthora infestans TaxID=4787 RepID=A0A833SN47_PHYIN|nr:hypothetical protein GN244_ATG10886 [Phytophthora infestans]KAF4037037.1 hypothetical protein GN244_ATG10887 [Phytophthora infestans]